MYLIIHGCRWVFTDYRFGHRWFVVEDWTHGIFIYAREDRTQKSGWVYTWRISHNHRTRSFLRPFIRGRILVEKLCRGWIKSLLNSHLVRVQLGYHFVIQRRISICRRNRPLVINNKLSIRSPLYLDIWIYLGPTGWSIASPFFSFGAPGGTYTGDAVITTSFILLFSFSTLVLFLATGLRCRDQLPHIRSLRRVSQGHYV